MLRAKVSIVGVRPLLMAAPTDILKPRKKSSTAAGGKHIYDDKEEAEAKAYRDSNGTLICPAYNIWSMLWQTAKKWGEKKRGEVNLGEKFKGSVFVKNIDGGDTIPLITVNGKGVLTEYKIHIAKVKIKTESIKRCRPQIDNWRLDFVIDWNPLLYNVTESNVKDVLEKASYVGLMDWRPAFGLFKITEFKVSELKEI